MAAWNQCAGRNIPLWIIFTVAMEIVVIKTNQHWMMGLEIRIYMFVGIYAFIYECLKKQMQQGAINA